MPEPTLTKIAEAVERLRGRPHYHDMLWSIRAALEHSQPDDAADIVTIMHGHGTGQWKATTIALLDDHLARK
jgi:hypothetical protein